MMRVALLVAIPFFSALAADKPGLTCASCHQKEATAHATTGMARALETGENGSILRAHPKMTFEQGPFRYEIARDGARSVYGVTDGKAELKFPIAWAFGQGAAGQTYVIERNGAFYESRVSYYKEIDGLDLTTGARPGVPSDIEEAFGRELSNKGAKECFGCHTTGALPAGKLDLSAVVAGIQCERCHTDAGAHMAGFAKPEAPKVVPAKLGKLGSEEMSDFCGQCHRTWATIASNGPHNITNVRFQPYRLANSKCYDSADARIRCTACHDPHAEPEAKASFYDAKCNSCHAQGAKAGAKQCKVAQSDCTSCHMPRVEVKGTHNKFTDHWIRIARAGQPDPY